MPYYPKLSELASSRLFTDTFYGYNHNLKIADGEFFDMKNLTGDYYPVMSQRKRRGIAAELRDPQGLAAKTGLITVDGRDIYMNENRVEGVTLSTAAEDCPKQLVSMGAYLCIFPDGKYFNTEKFSDCGSMGAEYTVDSGSSPVTYSICDMSGKAYNASTTVPSEPSDGDYWIDISGSSSVLKQYSKSSSMWVEIPTVYVKIHSIGIGVSFNVYDGVTISGCQFPGTDEGLTTQVKTLNASTIIYGKDDDYIVVTGFLNEGFEQTSGTITVLRKVPRMDYVTESNNRLWGCYYGSTEVNGETKAVNEIYACKLGDFKNWNCFMGVSTDSYAVTVGTDGVFTGAITHLGYPLFFKENCIHKVYGNYPAAYQLETINCRGVQDGSAGSLQLVNETLFYKSRTDICAFDGSLPTSVSVPLGDVSYKNAAAGAVGNKYYISLQDSTDAWHLFVFDAARGLWFREDNTHALFFARRGDELYYVDAVSKRLMTVSGTAGGTEPDVEWEAITGVIGYEYPDKKYLSRFNLRMSLPEGSACDLYIRYNSSGAWGHMAHMQGRGTDTFTLPVRPHRCDHLQLKLTGAGEMKLFSIGRILEMGSDV